MSAATDKSLLLTRDEFRQQVLARDNYRCVACGLLTDKLDAHHIVERRLFDNGGYFVENGVALCDLGWAGCHMLAEETLLTCEELREKAGIKQVIIPGHFYADQNYDKWGDIIHPDGTRTPGELFWDESVQKVLAAGNVLRLFRRRVKYPRTMHLPWSPGMHDDDRMLESTTCFEEREVVVTEKVDGESASIYTDYYHARSLESEQHESRGWIKRLQAEIGYHIPEGWRVCGENMYALHSIAYYDLPSYFLMFSVWNERNICLSWDDTVEYAGVLGLHTVPVLWRGIWDEAVIYKLAASLNTDRQEGLVVRLTDAFPYAAFRRSVAKWVRAGHVTSAHGWKTRRVVRNGLRDRQQEVM